MNADVLVSGRIYDHDTQQPMPFVSVSVNDRENDNLITGTVSDENGKFSFEGLELGSYSVNISYLGYEGKSVSVFIGELSNIYNLGKIELKESATALKEVVISGQKQLISQKLDKKSFDIKDNISQAGGSVLDVMANMPGVSVDREGKVVLRGSDKVMVLIDGKQTALTGLGNQKGLDNIPASNIERIEIINNPSAKYDASGMGGIINIIYKKEHSKGFNGDVGLNFGVGRFTKDKKDLPSVLGSYSINPKVIPSLNMNYRTSSFNWFIQSEVMRLRGLPNNEFSTRHYDTGESVISQVPENRMQTHYIVKSGFDWYISDKNILSISGIYDYENHEDKADVAYFDLFTMKPQRSWQWVENENTGHASINADIKHKFDNPGQELTASLQFTYCWEDEKYRLHEVSHNRIDEDVTHLIAKENIFQLSVDYTHPLASGSIEAGAKGHSRRLPVTYNVERGEKTVIYPGLGDWSDWGEDIAALYANWTFEKPKFDVEAGMRYEYSRIFYDISSDNIYYPSNDAYDNHNIFPNVRLTWKMNKANRISLFYNKRIDRPGEEQLRIFPKYDDPELLKVGNPYLRPQYTDNLEAAYKLLWNSGSVFIAGYYKRISDHYSRIYIMDNRNTDYSIINKIYENTGTAYNKGVEVIFDQQFGKIWKLSASGNYYLNHIREYNVTVYFPYEREVSVPESKGHTWYGKLNNSFNIGKNRQFQLSGIYFAPVNTPQGRRLERWGVDAGYKQSFLNDKLEIVVSAKDIFNSMKIREEVRNEGFSVLYENFYETQVITLGAKVRF